jgi:hypothetical protein
MATGVQMQPRVGRKLMHDLGIGHRDDGIVGAGDDQRFLADQRQREDARPCQSRKQLMQAPHTRTGHQLAVEQPLDD